MKITRDDEHRYWVDGKEKPSVHAILEAAGITDVSQVLEYYLTRGTHVHQITELVDEDDLDYDGLDPALKPFTDAYLSFIDALKPVYLASEQFVYHPIDEYCGQLDRVAMISDVCMVVDFKSGDKPAWWTPIQLVAYLDALPAEVGNPKQMRAVSLKGDGTWEISKPYNITKARKAWRSCLNVYKLQQRKKV